MKAILPLITFLLLINVRSFVGAQTCSSGLDPVTVACIPVGVVNELVNPFSESKVDFLVWTRKNEGDNDYHKLKPFSDEDIPNSNLDSSLETYVLFHGFSDNGTKQWILEAKTKILKIEDANVISVNFSELVRKEASDLEYVPAVCNAFKVSKYSADVFNWLHESALKLDASRMHLIGHSLGAHVAGIMSQYMMGLPIGKVDRITGLDPAGPLFSEIYLNKCRLEKTQANYVDVIHTNGCDLLVARCDGTLNKLGHVDFFPNGGEIQPGCNQLLDSSCSHQRVTALYVESIGPPAIEFDSWPCSDWNTYESEKCNTCGEQGCLKMGFHVETSLNGLSYFLSTNATSPYAKGEDQ